MRYILASILATIVSVASANPSVVCVDTPTGKGSATYIGNGLYVTAHHVIDGDDHCLVHDPLLGTTQACQVVAISREDDLAILRTNGVVLTPPAKVAKAGISVGDRVFAFGYGASYAANDKPPKRRGWRGRVAGFGAIQGSKIPNVYIFNQPAIPGDSGGGVFSEDGKLIGPLFGTDKTKTYATRNAELRQLLGVIAK
jgi:S1-C subfamily serine protease